MRASGFNPKMADPRMCGRYTLTCPDDNECPARRLSRSTRSAKPESSFARGTTSRRGSAIPVVSVGETLEQILDDAEWGFARPSGGLVINARAETAEAPSDVSRRVPIRALPRARRRFLGVAQRGKRQTALSLPKRRRGSGTGELRS